MTSAKLNNNIFLFLKQTKPIRLTKQQKEITFSEIVEKQITLSLDFLKETSRLY